MATTLAAQITAHLAAKALHPTSAWLAAFLASQKTTTPLPALKQTALFRLLSSDFTESLRHSASTLFPADMLDGTIASRVLPSSIPVQVLSMEDIGRSRWGQIEAYEAAERGETTKGREVIRVVPGEENLSDPNSGPRGPHKLLLQDAAGSQAFAFEMGPIDGINIFTRMGVKLLLHNANVARGVVMLDPDTCMLLGGKIDEVDDRFREFRKDKLRAAIDSNNDEEEEEL